MQSVLLTKMDKYHQVHVELVRERNTFAIELVATLNKADTVLGELSETVKAV